MQPKKAEAIYLEKPSLLDEIIEADNKSVLDEIIEQEVPEVEDPWDFLFDEEPDIGTLFRYKDNLCRVIPCGTCGSTNHGSWEEIA